jgi:hypothetical protein
MDFDSSSFGVLVRPRVLCHTFNEDKFVTSKHEQPWAMPKNRNKQIQAIEMEHSKKLKELFQDLSIGNTAVDSSTSFVAKITSCVAYYYPTSDFRKIRNKEQFISLEKKLRTTGRRHGQTRVSVVAIGVELYGGFELTEHGYTPIKPWNVIQELLFEPCDLVPLERVVLFEQLFPGDLILTPRTTAVVLKNNVLKKPSWYKTSSVSSHKVDLLCGNRLGFVTLSPMQKFQVRSLKHQHLVGDSFTYFR